MPLAPSTIDVADRLGLTLEEVQDELSVERHGFCAALNVGQLTSGGATSAALRSLAWLLYGVRLGLDKRAKPTASDQDSPTAMRFRRTALRRYHEAPSVHGKHLPLLVPRLSRKIFEAVANTRAFCRPWLQTDLEILVVHETGKRLDILSVDEQVQSELSEDERWQKVRRALFYQSYKVRPRETHDVAGGRLRIFETIEGFGATRALLLPEYDYDAAREYGYFAVPTRDQIIIARPDDRDLAPGMLPELKDVLREAIAASDFGLSDAIFSLEPEEAGLFKDPQFSIEDSAPPVGEVVGEITAPTT